MPQSTKQEEETLDSAVWIADQVGSADAADAIWTAKAPSLRNTVLLIRTISAVLARAAMRFDDYFPEDEITEDGMIELLSLLDDELLRRVLAIICDTTADQIEETYTPVRAVRVLLRFFEIVDFGAILGEVRKAAERRRSKIPTQVTDG